MSYSADTFVADEQPTTAKWNKLWSNDASFNDGTGIADDAILGRHIAAGVVESESLNATIAFRAGMTGSVVITSEATVVFDSESFDLGSDYNNATGVFTAPVTGYYMIVAHLGLGNLADGAQVLMRIKVDGTAVALGTMVSANAANDPRSDVSDVIALTAGQQVTVTGEASVAESLDGGATVNYFGGFFIGV